jgi:hypothetical protein
MDQYSPAELSELYLQAQTLLDTQFQYWMTVSFAVVVAAFVAGDRLSRRLRYVVTTLYAIATLVVFSRAWLAGSQSLAIVTDLEERGAGLFNLSGGGAIGGRILLFVIGSISVVYFLMAADASGKSDDSS